MGLVDRLVQLLQAGEPLDQLGLGRDSAGRWIIDRHALRDSDGALPPVRFRRASLEGLRFQGITWDSVEIVDSVVSDCSFDESAIRGWYTEGSEWRACTFRQTRMTDFNMGGARRPWSTPTVWRAVDFTKADLRSTYHLDERYTESNFSWSRLDSVDFQGAVHVGSVFAGLVKDVSFRRRATVRRRLGAKPNGMKNVDFREANLRFCGFWDLDLRDVLLPTGASHIAFAPKVKTASLVLAALGADEQRSWTAGLRVTMERMIVQGPATAEAIGIVEISTLSGNAEARAQAVEMIRSAAEWCSVGGDY